MVGVGIGISASDAVIPAAGGGPFNPLTSIAWSAAFWAEDPSWSHPADGGTVTSLRDAGSKATNLTPDAGSGSGRTYVAASANLNSQPVLRLISGAYFGSGSWGAALTGPLTIVAVAYINVSSAASRAAVAATDQSSSNFFYIGNDATPVWAINRTTGIGGTAQATGKFLLYGFFDTTAAYMEVNGTQNASGTTSNTNMSGWRIGGTKDNFSNSYMWSGDIAFAAIYAGALSAGNKTSLKSWVASHYAMTIN